MAAAHAPQVRLTPAMFSSEPVSSNTVPAHITFTIDMRHPDAAVLESLDVELRSLVVQAAESHGCGHRIEVSNDCAPVVFDPRCGEAV